jgi:hypothetical protein
LFSVSGSRAAEASGQLEAEQRPAIRMQIRSSAENSRSNNRHSDKLVMPLLMMKISSFHTECLMSPLSNLTAHEVQECVHGLLQPYPFFNPMGIFTVLPKI